MQTNSDNDNDLASHASEILGVEIDPQDLEDTDDEAVEPDYDLQVKYGDIGINSNERVN